MKRQAGRIVTMLALTLAVAACAPVAAESPVTEAEARTMAEAMLAAYNDGAYAGWSANWSQTMKDAIGEEAFLSFWNQAIEITGRYERIVEVAMKPGETRSDAVRWEFTGEFEEGRFVLMIAFHAGSKLIEGTTLNPAT